MGPMSPVSCTSIALYIFLFAVCATPAGMRTLYDKMSAVIVGAGSALPV